MLWSHHRLLPSPKAAQHRCWPFSIIVLLQRQSCSEGFAQREAAATACGLKHPRYCGPWAALQPQNSSGRHRNLAVESPVEMTPSCHTSLRCHLGRAEEARWHPRNWQLATHRTARCRGGSGGLACVWAELAWCSSYSSSRRSSLPHAQDACQPCRTRGGPVPNQSVRRCHESAPPSTLRWCRSREWPLSRNMFNLFLQLGAPCNT